MNKIKTLAGLGWTMVAAVALSGCGRNEVEPLGELEFAAPEPGVRTIAVVGTPVVAAETIETTAAYVKAQWRTHVRAGRVRSADHAQPEENDVCLLILDRADAAALDPIASLAVEEDRAVLNVAAFQPTEVVGEGPAAGFQPLVNKEAMRGIGLMLGMEPCPFPRCALHAADSLQDLRNKGQNYCPPCQMKSEEALQRHNLERGVRTPPTPHGGDCTV